MAVFVSLDQLEVGFRTRRFHTDDVNLLDYDSASIVYLGIMLYVVYYDLEEIRPCFWFILSFLLFAASQAVLFLASQPLCEVSGYCSDPSKWTDRRYLPCHCDYFCAIPRPRTGKSPRASYRHCWRRLP